MVGNRRRPRPLLQRLRAHRARPVRRQGEAHLALAGTAPVVHPPDHHLVVHPGGVDHAQAADLVPIARGIEETHVVTHRVVGASRPVASRDELARHHVVDAGQEAVRGADVGQGLDVERGVELQAPVADAVAEAAGEPLARVAVLEVPGVEVRRGAGGDGEGDGAEASAGVVDGADAYEAGVVGAVDDPDESHQPGTVAGGDDQGEAVLLVLGEGGRPLGQQECGRERGGEGGATREA